ncbi:MAG TPA: hypothetical protein VGP72_12220 [Planctomycetota bacterium]|jgi:hypothetical protein
MTSDHPLHFVFVTCLLASAAAADDPIQVWPLWDGKETIADYAKRAGLEPTKTLDLGGGVTLETVLIPAGKFVMGTPEPPPVDEANFQRKILVGQSFFALGAAVVLLLLVAAVFRAVRERRRPQVSLARFVVMIVAAGGALLGGMHWWHSAQALAQARYEYIAALSRYKTTNENELFRYRSTETPAHDVTLTKPFYIGKYTVTNAQYGQVSAPIW